MIAVTGANGFVGRALVARLAGQGPVRPLVRTPRDLPGAVAVGDIGHDTDWTPALAGIDCVVHCAARVHMMQETAADPLAAFREVNVAGTRHLAESAAAAGVRRLVFLSSVKVLGERTTAGKAFRSSDTPQPCDPYGQSKWEAEQALWEVAAATRMEVVVIRPPLVYGPGVGANFLRLAGAVRRGWPLPLGAVDNRRSMVALDNLVDLIALCTHHPLAAGGTFLVSDGIDLSTPGLIRAMAAAIGRPARLWPVPVWLLQLGSTLLGQRATVSRLVESLQVDITDTCRRLDWQPPVTPEDGLRRTLTPEPA
ncbi:MAG: SDR family oxidoreductase [Burkholderiaceae bacterium]